MSEYRVVENQVKEVLEKEVNELLSQGWELKGGIAVSGTTKDEYTKDFRYYVSRDGFLYFQAMVKP